MNKMNNSEGDATQPAIEKQISDLPQVWVGFIFAGIFLFAEIIEVSMRKREDVGVLTFLTGLGGLIFWLFCIHRFHKILAELSIMKYPISPGWAVGGHFIPFYNLYWVFKWPAELSKFIKAREVVTILPGSILGFLLLLAFILSRTIDGGLGLASIFGVTTYIASKLRQQIVDAKSRATVFQEIKETGYGEQEYDYKTYSEEIGKEEEEVNLTDYEKMEVAKEEEIEQAVSFWEERVAQKETQVSNLSVDIQELKIKLSIFEGEYNARVGILYVKLDKINLGIKKYEHRIKFAKQGKLSADMLQDIEDDVRDTFSDEREKVNNLEDETFESSQEYERHLEEEQEVRLDEESEQELKRLYRELAKKYHPDKAIDKKQSKEYHKIMAEINEAYKAKNIEKLRSFAERAEREEKIAKETLRERLDRLKRDDKVLSGIITKLEEELRSLKPSETYRLMKKVRLAGEEGKDLLEQLASELKGQIAESQDILDTLIAKYKDLVKDLS